MKSKKRFFSALLCLALALSLTQGAWAGTFTNNGTFTNGATGTIQNSGTFTNDTNGTVINNGAFTNEATGTIKNQNTNTSPAPFSGSRAIVNKSTVANAITNVPNELVTAPTTDSFVLSWDASASQNGVVTWDAVSGVDSYDFVVTSASGIRTEASFLWNDEPLSVNMAHHLPELSSSGEYSLHIEALKFEETSDGNVVRTLLATSNTLKINLQVSTATAEYSASATPGTTTDIYNLSYKVTQPSTGVYIIDYLKHVDGDNISTSSTTGSLGAANTNECVLFSGDTLDVRVLTASTISGDTWNATITAPAIKTYTGTGFSSNHLTVKIPSALTGPNARNFIVGDFAVKDVAVTPYMSDDTAMTYLAMQGDTFSFTLNAADGYVFTAPPVLVGDNGTVELTTMDDTAPYQYSIKLAGDYDLTDLALKNSSVLTSTGGSGGTYGVNVSIGNNGNVTSGLCVEIVGDSSQHYDLYLCNNSGAQILYYGNMPGRSVCNNWYVTKEDTATTAKLFLKGTNTEVWSGEIPRITTVKSPNSSLVFSGAGPSGSATSYNSATKEYTYTFTGLDFATYTYRIEKTGSAYLLSGSSYTTTDRLDSSGGTTYTLVATKSEGNATTGFTLTQYESIPINITNTLTAS